MTKRVFWIFTAIFFLGNCAQAMTLQQVGSAVIQPTQVTQNATITYASLGLISMTATALDAYLTNATTGTQIPISDVSITRSGLTAQLSLNNAVSLTSGTLSLGILTVTDNLTISVNNIGALPAGTYTARIQFDVLTGIIIPLTSHDTGVLTLTIVVPANLNIAASISIPIINVTQVFNPSATGTNSVSTVMSFTANENWIASIDTTSMGTVTRGSYYFTVSNPVGPVTSTVQGKVQLNPGQVYQIANGTQTSTNIPYGAYTPTSINIDYSWENNGTSILVAGSDTHTLTHTIQSN